MDQKFNRRYVNLYTLCRDSMVSVIHSQIKKWKFSFEVPEYLDVELHMMNTGKKNGLNHIVYVIQSVFINNGSVSQSSQVPKLPFYRKLFVRDQCIDIAL